MLMLMSSDFLCVYLHVSCHSDCRFTCWQIHFSIISSFFLISNQVILSLYVLVFFYLLFFARYPSIVFVVVYVVRHLFPRVTLFKQTGSVLHTWSLFILNLAKVRPKESVMVDHQISAQWNLSKADTIDPIKK